MVPKKQLIYADDLIKIMRAEDIRYQDVPWSTTAVAKLCEPMTVDAVEVVHGQWVFGTANHREYMKCSVCLKSQTPTGVFTYCPNCGAKMDGDGNG